MGLWNIGETGIGILISCLSVMPKFSPKIFARNYDLMGLSLRSPNAAPDSALTQTLFRQILKAAVLNPFGCPTSGKPNSGSASPILAASSGYLSYHNCKFITIVGLVKCALTRQKEKRLTVFNAK